MTKLKNVTETVDTTTGEVITTSKSYTIKSTTPEFYMTFINAVAPIYQITRITDRHVLNKLCELSEYNTGRVKLTPAIRKELLTALGQKGKAMSTSQLSNSLSRLIKANLISGSSGDYLVNPSIFWKGTNAMRERLLEKEGSLPITIEFQS